MSSPASGATPDGYTLLRAFLSPHASSRQAGRAKGRGTAGSQLQDRLPSGGTLPGLEARWGETALARMALSSLRSLAQVLFINNPISGLLLLLALLIQSPWMGLFAGLGIVSANLTARAIAADAPAASQGIYGFNGALVGAAIAAFSSIGGADSLVAWMLIVVVGAIVTTLLLHGLGRWLFRVAGLPPLTLPFCLVTWLLLALVASLNHPTLQLAEHPSLHGGTALLPALVQAVPRGFGQVLFCPGVLPGILVLLATAVASPLAALVGALGGLAAAITGLLIGASSEAVDVGLWSYNGVLTAIAIGGTFYAPTRVSVAIGVLAAAAASLITPGLSSLLARVLAPGFPLLHLPFIITSLAMMLVIRWSLPSLLPVALHAVFTPEEHRRRYAVSRDLLADFRQRLGNAAAGGHRFLTPSPSLATPNHGLAEDQEAAAELRRLFRQLDRNSNGRLSVAELATGLMQRRRGGRADLINRNLFQRLRQVLAEMDVDGDGAVDEAEFTALMLRLQRLSEGEDRLMRYLMPVDVNGDAQLDPAELRRLFGSVGQPPLTPAEERHLFGPLNGRLSWSAFIDRLLFTR